MIRINNNDHNNNKMKFVLVDFSFDEASDSQKSLTIFSLTRSNCIFQRA